MVRWIYCKLTKQKYEITGAGSGMLDGGIDGTILLLIVAIGCAICG